MDFVIDDIRLSGLHQQRMLNALSAYEMWMRDNTLDERISQSICPEREDFKLIYKQISAEPVRIDLLYERNFHQINPFKLRIILSVFSETGLCKLDLWNGYVTAVSNPPKVDLFNTPTMKRIL
jgi:hypothetical protein